jgi:CBS domain-containing protein
VSTDQHNSDLDGWNRLPQIASSLKNGDRVEPVTVREFLRWFGAKRRGAGVGQRIERLLSQLDLRTEPYFDDTFIDGLLEFRLGRENRRRYPLDVLEGLASTESLALSPATDDVEGAGATSPRATATVITFPGTESTTSNLALITDPTFRVGRLRSANTAPISVTPNSSLGEATTKMLLNDFSQLPVINGAPNATNVKGVVSWHSIGMCRTLGLSPTEVRECMEAPARIINADTSLLDAIGEIARYEYVLVKDKNNTVSGIVTASDLSVQFRELSEPFLLLNEIENYIRVLIARGNFGEKELHNASDPKGADRPPNNLYDLT